MDLVYLFSLLEGYNFRLGRRDWWVWSPNSSNGFSCKLFHSLINPSPVGELVFLFFRGLRSQGKYSFLHGKFYMVLLTR